MISLFPVLIIVWWVIFLAHKKENNVEKSSSETAKEKETLKENVEVPYPNLGLVAALRGRSGGAVDSDFQRNRKYPSAWAGDCPSRRATTAERDRDEASALILRWSLSRGVTLLHGARLVPLCSEEQYRVLRRYRLTLLEMSRCGYIRPTPKKSGSVKWTQGKRTYSCRNTCTRCGSTFFITPDEEYYATLDDVPVERSAAAGREPTSPAVSSRSTIYAQWGHLGMGTRHRTTSARRPCKRVRPGLRDVLHHPRARGDEGERDLLDRRHHLRVVRKDHQPHPRLQHGLQWSDGRTPAQCAHHAARCAACFFSPFHCFHRAGWSRTGEQPARAEVFPQHCAGHSSDLPSPSGPSVPTIAALIGGRLLEP
ncbi:hypothetical protein HPB48_016455 [Haemaphysalis longicornis]|uniref:Uncharacterized protein n=1 Tax=Haemaphysalis longicornis TaxID=44386 RepID=A0A9J6FDX0_HAELO|nr:hypothetical protein HPB48_016455 [Haemaphysalis longicornis]